MKWGFRRPKPPGRDSAGAKANATLFLTTARSIDGMTAEKLAYQFRLKPATAETMLAQEQTRRAR